MVSLVLLVVGVLAFLVATILEVMKDPSSFPIFHDPFTVCFLGLALFAASFLPWAGWVGRSRQ